MASNSTDAGAHSCGLVILLYLYVCLWFVSFRQVILFDCVPVVVDMKYCGYGHVIF